MSPKYRPYNSPDIVMKLRQPRLRVYCPALPKRVLCKGSTLSRKCESRTGPSTTPCSPETSRPCMIFPMLTKQNSDFVSTICHFVDCYLIIILQNET
jgi:hypothetical protein